MRILFSSLPVRSHLEPLFPTAHAAREAGHEVMVVTGPDLAPFVTDAGIPVRAVAPTMAANLRVVRDRIAGRDLDADPQARLHALVFDGLIRGVAAANEPVLLDTIDAWRPDLVITTLAEFAGTIAAARAGVENVVHGFGPQPAAGERDGMLTALAEAARSVGAPDPRDAFTGARYIDIWPTTLIRENQLFPHPILQRPDHALVPPQTDSTPTDTVYVTFGTTHQGSTHYIDGIVDGALACGARVVVTASGAADALRGRRSGDRLEVHAYLPQQEVIRRSEVVVHHGGSGTAIAALSAGVPSVVVPLSSDHHLVAQQIEKSGAGLAVDPAPDGLAERVHAAIATIRSDPAFGMRSRRMARAIRSMPSASVTIATITVTSA